MKFKITISEILFYLAYTMWIIANVLEFTYYRDLPFARDIFKVLIILSMIILFQKIIYDNKYSLKTLKWLLLFILILLISIRTNSNEILYITIFIYSARNIEFKKIAKFTFYLQSILMIIVIGGALLGIIPNEMFIRSNGTIRYALGYTWCTFSSNFFFHIILLYVFIKDKMDFKLINLAIILIINRILFNLTDTKFVYYLIILLMITVYINKYIKRDIKVNLINKLIYEYSFLISAVISIGLSILYNPNNNILNSLNNILTDRLGLGHGAFLQYGIPLLGQKVIWITGTNRPSNSIYMYVDSSYLNIAINYGLIILLLICMGFTFILKGAMKNNKKTVLIVLLFFAIHNITDPQLLDLRYQPFLLMFGIFFRDNKKVITIQK
ncbi:MAG: hypothetical protein KIB43_09810 [Clostridium baratii]|uniref:hypothetical protein n=1 Tax=Clostridium baratii TaxID=1561 RepID=UPI00242C0459|nr:hypothetical protein [Clostridium baratii]MBS6007242.1 hypothetical protein [Clostridium baratii]